MRFFALSALTSIAFGVFCSAAPTPVPNGVQALDIPSAPLAARDAPAPSNLKCVLDGAAVSLAPIVEAVAELHTAVDVEVTLATLLAEVVVIIQTTIAEVTALVGTTEQLLFDDVAGVVMDVEAIVACILGVLKPILTILACVISLVGATLTGQILPLVGQILDLVLALLNAILAIVGAFAADVICLLVQELGALVSVLVKLGATALCVLLHISI
ncbi:hypothetical protein BJ322DRAFT_1215693 [Thelephora terrestris]|uniref:Uncharacterized protein n=1 Tax=Thelephora terrestris TaxID=56493 RepID=A0A9P6LCG0_9AGAM|nr:hypothetical protein BJ322DRAFT_1215693 [Thelephora terrestris]